MSIKNTNSVGERAFGVYINHWIKENDPEKLKQKQQTASQVIRQHTGLPYCLGGNCAKYQGFDNTYEFLKREHPYIWRVFDDDIIKQKIKDEILNWID